jgi:hypothetical protein
MRRDLVDLHRMRRHNNNNNNNNNNNVIVTTTLNSSSSSGFPLLCECTTRDGFVEHRDMFYTYVLWVLPDDRHVAFIHKDLIFNNIMHNGVTVGELVMSKKGLEEPCKMISRQFVKLLGYKPDYVVITTTTTTTTSSTTAAAAVSDDNDDDAIEGLPTSSTTTTTCGYTMHAMLKLSSVNPTMEHIRTLAEGPGEPSGCRNQAGQLLTSLSSRLAAKGLLSDPKYFPDSQRDSQLISNGMCKNELKLRKLFRVFVDHSSS